MINETDLDVFLNSMDEFSRKIVELIRSKDSWVDDSDPEVKKLILEVDTELQKDKSVFKNVETELAVKLASKFDIVMSLVFLRELSAAQSALVYKMMNPDSLRSDESLLYHAVFMRRLTSLIKTPLIQEIYGSQSRVSVVKKYLSKSIAFKIVDQGGKEDA